MSNDSAVMCAAENEVKQRQQKRNNFQLNFKHV